MASFKLNIARIQGSPTPQELVEQMESYGLPESEEFGVLEAKAAAEWAFGSVVRKTQQAVQKLDPESQQIVTGAVEKATVYPFGVQPQHEILELYAGAASGIEQMSIFFGSCLALSTVVEPIEIDVLSAIQKLMEETKRFQLRSVRVSDFAANSYMIGPYTPKFVDTPNGVEFVEQYVEGITSASVKFQGPTGRVTVSVTPKACFSYSCKDDDQDFVKATLRKLI
ncbi:MAG: hypothetical protein ACLFVU_14600 [Phycisphaerae bacterium]